MESELRKAELEATAPPAVGVNDHCNDDESSSESRSRSRKRQRLSHFGDTAAVQQRADAVLAATAAAGSLIDGPIGSLPVDSSDLLPGSVNDDLLTGSGRAWKTKMCIHFEAGTCRRGNACSFAHGCEELALAYRTAADRTGVPATTRMDFSANRAAAPGQLSRAMSIPQQQVNAMMTDRTKELLIEMTGVQDVQWKIASQRVTLVGKALQVEKAQQLLTRVTTHCMWGVSEPKIHGLLRPRTDCTSAKCRLSPMVPALKEFSANMTLSKNLFSIGTGSNNDLVVRGEMLSRNHVTFEFVPSRGAIYVIDTSTNGTFVNGRRLPEKGSAKVVLWHGDEVLLQDPEQGGAEFGYMVNLEFMG